MDFGDHRIWGTRQTPVCIPLIQGQNTLGTAPVPYRGVPGDGPNMGAENMTLGFGDASRCIAMHRDASRSWNPVIMMIPWI